jgi:hypothetical protein
MLEIKRFDCDDGDVWYSVYDTDEQELVTCEMHSTEAGAEAELRRLAELPPADREAL